MVILLLGACGTDDESSDYDTPPPSSNNRDKNTLITGACFGLLGFGVVSIIFAARHHSAQGGAEPANTHATPASKTAKASTTGNGKPTSNGQTYTDASGTVYLAR
jgi:hypothetical protein